MSTEHSKRAAKFTQNVEKTTWHDATFWSVRQKRDKMAQELPEWEDLREHASEIKMHTITHLGLGDVYKRQVFQEPGEPWGEGALGKGCAGVQRDSARYPERP